MYFSILFYLILIIGGLFIFEGIFSIIIKVLDIECKAFNIKISPFIKCSENNNPEINYLSVIFLILRVLFLLSFIFLKYMKNWFK